MTTDTELVRATTSFLAAGNVRVAAGELYEASSAIVQSRPHLFAPAAGAVVGAVRTTAAVAGDPPPFLPPLPTAAGKKAEWVAYAASHPDIDLDAEELEGLTRDEIRGLVEETEGT